MHFKHFLSSFMVESLWSDPVCKVCQLTVKQRRFLTFNFKGTFFLFDLSIIQNAFLQAFILESSFLNPLQRKFKSQVQLLSWCICCELLMTSGFVDLWIRDDLFCFNSSVMNNDGKHVEFHNSGTKVDQTDVFYFHQTHKTWDFYSSVTKMLPNTTISILVREFWVHLHTQLILKMLHSL